MMLVIYNTQRKIDKIVVYSNLMTMTCTTEMRENIKLSRRKYLDVQWDAKKQNDTFELRLQPSESSFLTLQSGIPGVFTSVFAGRASCETSRLLTSPSSPDSGSFPLRIFHTCREHSVYAKSTDIHERYIHVPRGRSEYISQAGIRLSPYRGKILVALVDLLAEIRTVMVESYET